MNLFMRFHDDRALRMKNAFIMEYNHLKQKKRKLPLSVNILIYIFIYLKFILLRGFLLAKQ